MINQKKAKASMISQKSISAMGKAMANDFIEYMDHDFDFQSMLVVKVEEFIAAE